MSKLILQRYIDDDELDLSLQNLTDVPVKEIAKFPKLRFIDLSCNAIENIPVDIGLLVKITKLDLSKNKLKSIPEEIGKMVNLEHLDLRDNKLATLPLGICDLKKLKWLDLKGNPLNENLRTVAGDCLDEAQCAKCAKNVLALLETMRSKKQKSDDKRKLKENEKLKQKAIEEKELRNRRKLEKTQERLMKRNSAEEKMAHMKNETNSSDKHGDNFNSSNDGINSVTNGQSSVLGSLLGGIFAVLLLAVVVMSVLFVCNHPLSGRNEYSRQACHTINANLPACLVTLRDHTWQYLNKYAAFMSSA